MLNETQFANIREPGDPCYSTYKKWYMKSNNQQTLQHGKGGGRKKLYELEEYGIVNYIRAKHEDNWNEIVRTLHLNCSYHTIRRMAARNGLFRRVARHKTKLTDDHKAKRLQYAQEHIDWSAEKWTNMVYVDESSVWTNPAYRARVTRPRNQAYLPKYVSKIRNIGKIKLNVLAFFVPSKNYLKFYYYQTSMNGPKFCELFLKESKNIERLFELDEMPFNFMYILDNAGYHKSAYTINAIKHHNEVEPGRPVRTINSNVLEVFDIDRINVLSWPPYFQDCNVLENVFGTVKSYLRRKLMKEFKNCSTWFELLNLLEECRSEFTALNCAVNYGLSVPKRLEQIIERNGDYSDY
ncbi:hypothetical protein HDE_04509 [Halotydeus destructor]|nr:hypothetical protein HDE_04509 [Halotydeus destructor]